MCYRDIDFALTYDNDQAPDMEMDYCDVCGDFTLHLGTLGGACRECFDDRHCDDEF